VRRVAGHRLSYQPIAIGPQLRHANSSSFASGPDQARHQTTPGKGPRS
jgi:hypothetical protein